MIDLSKYVANQEDLEFLEEIRSALSADFLNEVHLLYKDKHLSIEPTEGRIIVFYLGQSYEFETIDEVFLNFFLDGKPFIEKVSELDYE